MSIEQTHVLDVVNVDPNTGKLILTISDHLPWGDQEHLWLLQEKVNAYIGGLEGGDIVEQFPDAANREVLIDVVCKYQPDMQALDFLGKLQKALEQIGLGLRFRVPEFAPKPASGGKP